jgi:hypothetical protein
MSCQNCQSCDEDCLCSRRLLPDYLVVGFVAHQFGKRELPIQVCESGAGFYLGTLVNGSPFSRESVGYYPTATAAADALRTHSWENRTSP